eukprot:COSAG02_NODE_4389_length_5419_cov_3.867293_3_plen_185_part_00
MSAELSERIGQIVIPATVQCTTPETTGDDLRMLTVYGVWTPDDQLEYAGTTTQALYVRERQHRSDAWRDETCCPLYRHAATLPNRLDDWTFRPILQCQIDPVRCRAARGQIENYVIQALRGAGYNLHNKSLAYDTNDRRRAQMKAWRIAHGQGTATSYMSWKSAEHRARRRQFVQSQGDQTDVA